MKYLLVGDDFQVLFIENDAQNKSVFYNKAEHKWLKGGTRLNDYRVGFDESEPEDSLYRYGNGSCMPDIVIITKEQAEAFISQKISEEEILKLLM